MQNTVGGKSDRQAQYLAEYNKLKQQRGRAFIATECKVQATDGRAQVTEPQALVAGGGQETSKAAATVGVAQETPKPAAMADGAQKMVSHDVVKSSPLGRSCENPSRANIIVGNGKAQQIEISTGGNGEARQTLQLSSSINLNSVLTESECRGDVSSPAKSARPCCASVRLTNEVFRGTQLSRGISTSKPNSRKKWRASKKAKYAAMLAVIMLFVCSSVAAANLQFVYEIKVAGNTVGYVSKADQLELATSKIEKSLSDGNFIVRIDRNAELTPKFLISRAGDIENKLKTGLMTVANEPQLGVVVYVDGVAAITLKSVGEAKRAVTQAYTELAGEIADNAKIELLSKIEIVTNTDPSVRPASVEDAANLLRATAPQKAKYTAQHDDTKESIAQMFGTTWDSIKKENPSLADVYEGVLINILASQPWLSVKTTEQINEVQDVPYKTKEQSDKSLASGKKVVVQEGKSGTKTVLAIVVKLNGQEVDRQIISENVTTQPQDEIVRDGALSAPSQPQKQDGAAQPAFVRPYVGAITSAFGYRSGGEFHTGTDFAGSTGDTIRAAEAGTVIGAGWTGNYGYLVKIDHGGGYVTYYAHCSQLLVSVGQKVAKGQAISRLGSTGNSTGPHLHFEVRKNNVPQNPMTFLARG